MTSLLIVESPAKCSKIQGFLGPGWKVIATMGHIRALEESLDAIGLDKDFEPTYAFLKEKAKAIAQLRDCAKEASKVFLASDDDREGEAISYSVAVLLKLPATTPRIVFHEITKEAITKALQNPRTIDMNRVNAQQARAVLDMMVGFTISPLLWKFVGAGLSAGRCQTPALRLVAERETDITGFTSETTWAVTGEWLKGSTKFEAALVDALDDEESATNYLENIHDDAGAVITEAKTRPTMESPPKPLITSTLQQEASALYGTQPKNTMRIAQRLYEAGHITYMRTDHAVISEEAKKDAQAYVRTTYGEAYIGSEIQAQTATAQTAQTKSKKAKAKDEPKAQEAHEAIRPTHIELTDLPQSEDWNAVDRKIYTLIWNRTVQSVMAPCRGEERTVIFKATGDPNDLEWSAKWRRITFQGWRRVNQAIADLDESGPTTATAEESAWTLGQSLEAGQHITWATLEAAPKETKAAPRYTEATLVRELEKRGIGRPSTFASLVGTILDKTYVEKRDVPAKEVLIKSVHLDHVDQWPPTVKSTAKKVGGEKQKLAPTPLGTSALEFCLKEFPGLFAFTFTKEMEERLDKVAEGTEPWKTICRDTWGSYSTKYDELKKKTATQTQSAKQQMFGDIKAIQTKKGPLLLIEGPTKEETVFYGWPKGVSFAAITADLATKHVADAKKAKEGATIGEYEGQPMVRMKGPYGEYVTCGSSNVPWKEGDTPDTIRERLKSKGDAVLHTLGPFEFRRGPYGVFMFKKDVQQKKFVGLPQALDPKALTVEAAIKIYQTGLQEKAKKSTYASKRPPFKKKTDG